MDDPANASRLQVPYIVSDAMMEEDLEREPLCKPRRDQLGHSQLVDEGRKHLGSSRPSTPGSRRSVTINTFGAHYDTKQAVRVAQTRTASHSGFVTTFEESCSSSGEFVRIEGSDVTTKALELCEKWALKPYRGILMVLGWLPLGTDKLSPVQKKALHLLLVSFWTLVIVGAFITQILSCFRRDKFLAFKDDDSWVVVINKGNVGNDSDTFLRALKCNDHLFNNFIFLDFLLIAVYLYGVYLFWGEERDLTHLHTLASRSFVQNSLASANNNRVLLVIIMVFFFLGCSWIVVSFIIRVLTIICAELFMNDVVIEWGSATYKGNSKITLIIFSVVGFVFFDIVYVLATMNYAVQSEFIIWLLKAISTMLCRNGYCNVDAAIKDILECRRYLRTLNGRASTAVAMLLFIFGNIAILGIVYGFKYSNNEEKEDREIFKNIVAVMNITLWLSIIALPIIQATRVTHACQQLKDTATEIRSRPQLYADTPQLDLDSFLILTQAIRLRATLFGVPIYPSFVYAVLASVTFVMIFLAQINIYSFSRFI